MSRRDHEGDGHRVRDANQYLSSFCIDCVQWLEEVCQDAGCHWCVIRPLSPIDEIPDE